MDWETLLKRAIRTFRSQDDRSLRPLRKGAVERVEPTTYIFNLTFNMDNSDRSTNYGPRIGSVVARDLTNAFNTINNIGTTGANEKAELTARLNELHTLVTDLVRKIPQEDGERTARDLKSFVEEIASPKPRKKWYEVSADGLLEAAKAVASMTEPITEAVKAVLALLTP